jgi:hypothetical protein
MTRCFAGAHVELGGMVPRVDTVNWLISQGALPHFCACGNFEKVA